MQDCSICQKHKNLNASTGPIIAEQGGLVLTHFPFLADEKATRGHLLVETRRHLTDLTEMNEAESAALGSLIRAGAALVKAELGAEHIYLFRINDKTPHLHFHLVPRYAGTPREFWGPKILEWPDRPTILLPEIRAVAEKLKAAHKN